MPKTIAFFGATGGCTITALSESLKAGHACAALVRTPAKLESLLTQHGHSLPLPNLRIVQGDAASTPSCLLTIRDPATGVPADTIIYGIGGTPDFSNPLRATLD